MLLQFIIEPEAFHGFTSRENAEWRASLLDFMSFWRSHGVLVLPSDFDPEKTGLQGQRLNDFKSLIINESFLQYRRRKLSKNESPNWASVQSWNDIKQYVGRFDLALLERVRAACLDLDDDSMCAHSKDDPPVPIEIGRWNLVNHACEVRKLTDRAQAPVRQTEPPTQIWAERFQKYAAYSNTISVIDLYAARNRNLESLSTFLKNLITRGRGPSKAIQRVKIFSTYDNPNRRNYDPNDDFHSIRQRLESQALGLPTLPAGMKMQIDIYLLPDKPDLRSHVRWIRFDDNVIELDKGLEVFKVHRGEPVSFQLKDGGNEDKMKKEQRMEKYCETRTKGDDQLLRVFDLKAAFGYLK